MTARKTTETPAPRFANYATKEATPTMQAYAEWLTRETGYAVDVQSVVIASWLRGEFQKSEENQRRIADAASAREQAKQERAERKAERDAKREQREAAILAKAEAILAAKKEKAA